MGVLFWIVAAGAAAGGYYCYRRLNEVEEEIRREIGEQEESVSEEESPAGESGPQPAEEAPPGEPRPDREVGGGPDAAESRILAAVEDVPGLLQTELYGEFPDLSKRTLQEKIRALEEEGRLRREKEGSSFRLFPISRPN